MASDLDRAPDALDALGGEAVLRTLLDDFLERVVHDRIIGFFFEGRDRERILDREVQLAASRLAPGRHTYGGRPLDAVHKPLNINKGHFRRRLAILRTVLRDHGVDEALVEDWLAHERALEDLVTAAHDCVD